MARKLFKVLFLSIVLSLSNCSKKEVAEQLDQDIFLGVGKWKIKSKGITSSKNNECDISYLILNSDLSFKIYFENNNVIVGKYQILDLENISLLNSDGIIGKISNVKVVDASISFEIDLTDICQSSLEGEKDETYQENKTFIADVEFEKYLIENGWDDVPDNYVLTSSISEIEFINAEQRNISSLVGIEDFKNLKSISAGGNNISGILDLSLNSALNYIDLNSNPLSKVYLKDNVYLHSIFIYSTFSLNELLIGNSPELKILNIHDTKINNIDLTNSTKIEQLRIWNSKLTELNLSKQLSLKYLYAQGINDNNKDISITLPDTKTLEMIWLDNNNVNKLDLKNLEGLKAISCNYCNLNEINVPNSDSLFALLINGNNLSKLDISKNPNLRILRAEYNLLNCISVHPNLANNIPPTCSEANIPINYEDDPNFSCYNGWNIIDFAFNNEYMDYPDSWMYDQGVTISTNCN